MISWLFKSDSAVRLKLLQFPYQSYWLIPIRRRVIFGETRYLWFNYSQFCRLYYPVVHGCQQLSTACLSDNTQLTRKIDIKCQTKNQFGLYLSLIHLLGSFVCQCVYVPRNGGLSVQAQRRNASWTTDICMSKILPLLSYILHFNIYHWK